MDFWDHLAIATTLSVRDYYRDKEKRQRKEQQFFSKCVDEITDSAKNFIDIVYNVFKKANPNYFPKEVSNGINMLPLYAFYKVLQAQGGTPSSMQTSLLEAFFNNVDVPIKRAEFLSSIRINNEARKLVEGLMGISDSFSGSFWITFFKALYVTKSDEATLTKVIESFSGIVMRFSILGKPQSEVAISIIEKFIMALEKQVVECRRLPESELDFFGEVHYLTHKIRIEDLLKSFFREVQGQDSAGVEASLNVFFVTMLYDLINMSTRADYDKAEILEKMMQRCSIKFDYTGYEVFKEMEERSLLYDVINRIRDIMFTGVYSWSTNTNREADNTAFNLACFGFLAGIEKELAEENPFSGFGQFAARYIADRAGYVLKWAEE